MEVYPGWEALNFALEGVPKFSSGEGHFQNENFVLELCKGQKNRAPQRLLWVPWVNLRQAASVYLQTFSMMSLYYDSRLTIRLNSFPDVNNASACL